MDAGVRPAAVGERVAGAEESDLDSHAISLSATGRRSRHDRPAASAMRSASSASAAVQGLSARPSASYSITADVRTSSIASDCGTPCVDPVAVTSATSWPKSQRVMSKSWMNWSLNCPPDVLMYASGGGVRSQLTMRNEYTAPSEP